MAFCCSQTTLHPTHRQFTPLPIMMSLSNFVFYWLSLILQVYLASFISFLHLFCTYASSLDRRKLFMSIFLIPSTVFLPFQKHYEHGLAVVDKLRDALRHGHHLVNKLVLSVINLQVELSCQHLQRFLCRNSRKIREVQRLGKVPEGTTTTTIVLRPFVQDYPGEPVPEETFTHPPS